MALHDSPTAFSAATQRLESPSAERNKDPIWGILSTRVIPRLTIASNSDSDSKSNSPKWSVLETAAGAGVHTEWFASKLLEATTAGDNKDINDNDNNEDGDGDGNSRPSQSFVWYPTDPDLESLDSIRARVEERNLGAFVATPQILALDATSSGDDLTQTLSLPANDPLDLVLSINMIHIAPWEATLGLMRVAGQRLRLHDESNDKGGYLYCYGPYKQDGIVVPSNESFDVSLRSRNPEWGVRNLADVIKAAENEGLELVEKIEMPANNTSLVFRRIRRRKEN